MPLKVDWQPILGKIIHSTCTLFLYYTDNKPEIYGKYCTVTISLNNHFCLGKFMRVADEKL